MESGVVPALAIAGVLLWLVYVVQDQEPAPKLCARCQEVTDYSYCTDCSGSGQRQVGLGKTVSCKHQRFVLWSSVICLRCRSSVAW